MGTGLIHRLFTPERRSRADYVRDFLSGEDMAVVNGGSGEFVTEETALQITWVMKCVSIISKTIASLPLNVHERLDSGGNRKATEHRLYNILYRKPNSEMTSFEFRRTLETSMLLWGNAYAYKDTDNMTKGGLELIPLNPAKMRVERDKNSKLVYKYTTTTGFNYEFPQDKILHIKDLSLDGIVGISKIAYAREMLGGAKITEKFGNKLFSSGARYFGTLAHPGRLGDMAQENLRNSLKKQYEQGILILEEGMTWNSISIPPEDAQFLETRQYSAEDIVSLFEIPLHKAGIMRQSSYSNIEQQAIEWVTDSLLPICVNWEQRLENSLFTPAEREKYYIKFQLAGLLRGDSQARGEFYTKQFQTGSISPNEIAELEERNPVEGGDERFVQLNMIPLSMAKEVNPGQASAGIPVKTVKNRLKMVYRFLFSDAIGRVYRREISAITRENKKNRTKGQFEAKIDEFYADLSVFIIQQVTPAVESLASAIGLQIPANMRNEGRDIGEVVKKYAERYILTAKNDILDKFLSAKMPHDPGFIARTLEKWEETKIDNETSIIIDMIFRQFFDIEEE
ncbi:MAG: phage portal protein [Candidatus Omnitrophica bacterium]|nr:phage portal protein [Candidatus Omnitrophota bacterium]